MLFNSYAFLLFLPIVWLLYVLLPKRPGVQNVLLLAASYTFYAWWDVRFLLLIAGLSLVGWLTGLGIARAGRESRRARWLCVLCITVCVGVLGAFKYYDFFISSLVEALSSLGLTLYLPLWRVVLPVGISFYTFQVISYVVDVRRGVSPASRDAVAFFTFISFFPQLVAGPIERARDLLPQLATARHPRYDETVDGLRLMLWGFVKKMLLADRCAPIVNALWTNPTADGTDLWWATLLFALQIYGDFSGYSDIAVGLGRLFGIRLSRNFALPYFARSVPDFWRRWHITLMAWLRDYVYIPLGGSRRGRWRTMGNTLVVFLVSGLWHGANWTFLIWGLYHAVWVIAGRALRGLSLSVHGTGGGWRGRLWAVAEMALTFFIVCIGWVFFRADSLAQATSILGRMFTDLSLHVPYGGRSVLIAPVLIIGAEWLTRRRRYALDLPAAGPLRYRALRWALYYALILAVLTWGGAETAFIYFQF